MVFIILAVWFICEGFKGFSFLKQVNIFNISQDTAIFTWLVWLGSLKMPRRNASLKARQSVWWIFAIFTNLFGGISSKWLNESSNRTFSQYIYDRYMYKRRSHPPKHTNTHRTMRLKKDIHLPPKNVLTAFLFFFAP